MSGVRAYMWDVERVEASGAMGEVRPEAARESATRDDVPAAGEQTPVAARPRLHAVWANGVVGFWCDSGLGRPRSVAPASAPSAIGRAGAPDAVVAALQQAHGDKTRAAKALGMSRATIYRKIRDYGILAPVRPLGQA